MRRALALAVAVVAAVALMAPPAVAHEHRDLGRGYSAVVGWLNEPAFEGYVNAVQLILEHGDHESAEPVEGAELEVVVIFGDQDGETTTDPLPLEPAFGAPGEYHASVIPTRSGTYTFHVTGTIQGDVEMDELFTSGEDTFGDIEASSTFEFPAQDPSRGELAQRAEQIDERLADARAEVAAANDAADQAKLFGYAGLGLAAIALLVALLRRPKAPPA
jgi:hypothetical protein